MTTHAVTPTGTIRALVARHPVPTMIVTMLAVTFALLVPPALAGLALEPFLIAGSVLAQLVPAVLVTAAADGRAGVRDLFRRIFRWRVHPIWYAVAFLALPVAALLGSAAVGSTASLTALVTDPAAGLAYLGLLAALPLTNLWEETAVTGVIQARLIASRGPVVAAVVAGVAFAAYHLPLQLGQPAGDVVLGMALITGLAILLRFVTGWLYVRTGGSVLLVAGLHATFNAVNNLFTTTAPGSVLALIALILIGVWGLGTLVATRGRLGTGR